MPRIRITLTTPALLAIGFLGRQMAGVAILTDSAAMAVALRADAASRPMTCN